MRKPPRELPQVIIISTRQYLRKYIIVYRIFQSLMKYSHAMIHGAHGLVPSQPLVAA